MAPRKTVSPTASPGSVEKNAAPSQWARRLARLVGEKFGVVMSENHSKNEGTYRHRNVVIKCAKSPMPPVSVLVSTLERIDQLWAVYIMPEGNAEVWVVDAAQVREHGYFTRSRTAPERVELFRRKIMVIGKLMGTVEREEVEACYVP
ncbi:MAG TPA: hypothetical protein VNA16_10665 [Abditibacteriaceae bacterium]|nr:hypothetical protein [Abditibacteriaceae bacterium]